MVHSAELALQSHQIVLLIVISHRDLRVHPPSALPIVSQAVVLQQFQTRVVQI